MESNKIMKKIVFISHGHPDLSKGGAEMASWNLYNLYKEHGYDCLYIARTDTTSHGGSVFSSRGDEILLHTGMTNWFICSTNQLKPLFNDLGELLQQIAPDIIHIHHYAHIGIELFPAVRRAVPSAKIVFTLHEFMAICMHNGQMVKKDTLKLCNKAVPSDCHQCFPNHSPGDFFLRKSYLMDQLSYVDAFISPSKFLAQRYVDWGLPEDQIHVLENVLPKLEKKPPRALENGAKRTKLAYFGQINPYKGLDILLKAIPLLPKDIREKIHLDVNGANLDIQTTDFKEKINALLDDVADCVDLRGSYEPEQLPNRMAECDWVVIPSIWWENSPVVIQEAINIGRPLLGSNIGGMKEKIEDIAGITFEARSATSLAAAIVKAIEPAVFDYWYEKLNNTQPAIKQHLAFIEELCCH